MRIRLFGFFRGAFPSSFFTLHCGRLIYLPRPSHLLQSPRYDGERTEPIALPVKD